MLANILIILGILFLLVLILAPVFYYYNRDKYGTGEEEEAQEDGQEGPEE
jgi:uncharacterized protein YpmB